MDEVTLVVPFFSYDTVAALERANQLQARIAYDVAIRTATSEPWGPPARPEDKRTGEHFPLNPISIHLTSDGSIDVRGADSVVVQEWFRRHGKGIQIKLTKLGTPEPEADTPAVVEAK